MNRGTATANVSPASPAASPLRRVPYPANVDKKSIIWWYVIPFAIFHLMLPLAFVPWLFSWTGLIMVPLGNYIFCSMGIGGGYHRLLTHHGFRCPKWFEHTLALLGVCCLQDTPARWVAIHRLHHKHSDEQEDPHTPLVNLFWSHMGWLLVENRYLSSIDTYEKYARDVLEDRFYLNMERNGMWGIIYAVHAVLFFLAGLAIGWATTGLYMGGVQFGLSLVLWGVIFRTIYTWHVTWGINSFSHRFGYTNYDTGENSRNNWLFALATNGEGWHNNHHADPRSAKHGHRWWELDVTYLTLCAFEKIGIVQGLVRPARLDELAAKPAPSIDPEQTPNAA
ncbi:MAG: acyl-CoA desaturase [Pirellulales bacterium]